MTALEFHNVSKTFHNKGREVRALKAINLQIPEGEVFGFVGPNGAGKSTTIKVMLDIITDYEGEVSIYGISSRNADARREIAFLPESPTLYDQFTPLEILKMALRMYGIRRKDEDQWCMQWLERFSVTPYAQRRIRQLSKGNVQRVALAHAMVASPKLLILDEPLSGLDPVGRKDVIDILLEYKRSGGSIFFTSHVLHDVERIADRFGFINAGELVTTQEPKDLITQDNKKLVIRYYSESDILTEGKCLRNNEYEYELEQSAIPDFIEQLNQVKGRVINITSATSLENLFFHILDTQP
jgi:ABC-2 type transport system ATP-binding protein